MSYCIKQGKDEIIVVTKEDHDIPPQGKAAVLSMTLDKDDEEEVGFVKPNGELNWSCPCVGAMVAGPCGYEFRQAFGCFHYSREENKGSDCINQFKEMHDCMANYPSLYGTFEKVQALNRALEEADREFEDEETATAGSHHHQESVDKK